MKNIIARLLSLLLISISIIFPIKSAYAENLPNAGSLWAKADMTTGKAGYLSQTQQVNQDIGLDGLSLWVKADKCLEDLDGDGLNEWEDLSYNGNHLKAPAVNATPVHIENAINGHGSMKFDGVDDYVRTALCTPVYPKGYYEGDTTVFLVMKAADNPDGRGFFNTSNGSASINDIDLFRPPSSSRDVAICSNNGGGNEVYSTLSSGYGTDDFHLISFRVTQSIDSSNNWLYSYVEGWYDNKKTLAAYETDGRFNRHYGYTLAKRGDGLTADCEIAELIVYQKALDDSHMSSVNNYLNSKYFNDFYIQSLDYDYEESDHSLSEVVKEGGYIRPSIVVKNRSQNELDNAVIICTINNNNKLFGLSIARLTHPIAQGETENLTFSKLALPDNLEKTTIKFYMWNSLGGDLIPLRAPSIRTFDFYNYN